MYMYIYILYTVPWLCESYTLYIHFKHDDILLRYRCELHLTIISFSKVLSDSLHRSGLNVFPAMLNSLSTGAEVAWTDRYPSNWSRLFWSCVQLSMILCCTLNTNQAISYFSHLYCPVTCDWRARTDQVLCTLLCALTTK